jgi:hypothetical protein
LHVAAGDGSLHPEGFGLDTLSLPEHVLAGQRQGVPLRGPMQQPDAETSLER